jgi:hypothetical protein
MFQINLHTLAKACEKSPKLLTICKGHSQILCKLALEQSGFTKGLNKWNKRYCYVVKYLLYIVKSVKYDVSLNNKKRLLEIIEERNLKIPTNIKKFIIKNKLNINVQKGNGQDKFNTYLDELDLILDELKKQRMYENIDNYLEYRNLLDDLEYKLNKLNQQLNKELTSVDVDANIKNNILKQRNLLQKRINEIEFILKPLETNPLSPLSQLSPTVSSPTRFLPRAFNASKQISSPTTSKKIFIPDLYDYQEDDSYSLSEISINLPDILQSYFTLARLETKFKLPKNIVMKAVSDYNAIRPNDLTVFKDNLVEIDTIFGNGNAIGKIIDTDNIVNTSDMYRYGVFPLTVFI